MNLGLDIHGVIDKNPKLYVELAKVVRSYSFESKVYIITGHSVTPPLIEQLRGYDNGNVWWDELVSIQDELLLREATVIGYTYENLEDDETERPLFGDFIWNSFKGLYCAKNKIDLMIDDSIEYRRYFSTPFLLA